MYIYKDKGIIYGNMVIDFLSYYLTDNDNLGAKIETFYNCREQGYVIEIHNKEYDKRMCLWIYANRWSDEPTLTWDYINIPTEEGNRYGEEAWTNRTKSFDNCIELTNYIKELISNYYDEVEENK